MPNLLVACQRQTDDDRAGDREHREDQPHLNVVPEFVALHFLTTFSAASTAAIRG